MPAILGPTENQVFDPSYLKARKSPAQTNAGTSDSTMGLCHRCHMCRMCRMCHNTKTPLALHNTFITLDIDIGRYRSRSDTDTPPAILITFFCGNRSFQSWLISSATAALASKAGTFRGMFVPGVPIPPVLRRRHLRHRRHRRHRHGGRLRPHGARLGFRRMPGHIVLPGWRRLRRRRFTGQSLPHCRSQSLIPQ